MKTKISVSKLRMPIQILSTVMILFSLQAGLITISMLIIAGSAAGLIFGKVFCRWVCPMGLLMEAMMGMGPDQKTKSLYQYHKLGCPIAWVSGLLNRISILTIRKKKNTECKECGLCDKACYIATLDTKYSLFKKDQKNPADSYTCSRCLACVDSCPTRHIGYSLRK